MALAIRDPKLLPVIRACIDYPAEEFTGRSILQGLDPRPHTLTPLLKAGILARSQKPRVKGRPWYRFVDRNGAARAMAELGA